ncbi:MAG: serine/threonine-protein kinase [Candidatus Riflebacteria bacterium]
MILDVVLPSRYSIAMQKAQTQIPTGTIINGCKVIGEVGSGGMGTVYKAHDEALGRLVAVKIMHDAAAGQIAKDRFAREAATIARLDHPGIIRIYSYGEYDGQPFFIMEFVDGRTIKEFIRHCNVVHAGEISVDELIQSGYLKNNHLETPFFLQDQLKNPLQDPDYSKKIRNLMLSAASAMAEAHRQGVIHRDIKSSNFLIVNDERVKLLDFGLVKPTSDSEITRTDHFMGTLSYAAPEQLMGSRGKISFRTDVYCFGVVLYELATLSHPIKEEDPGAIVTSIIQGNFVPPSQLNANISSDLEAIIQKCMQKDPTDRYADGAAVFQALKGSSTSSTWFSGFTEILKGWFQKESSENDKLESYSRAAEREKDVNEASPALVAKKFFKSARRKFFKNFAVLEAIEDLKQALEIEPENVDTVFLLGFAMNAISQGLEVKPYLDRCRNGLDDKNEKEIDKLELVRTIFIGRNYDEGRKISLRLQQIYRDDLDFSLALFFCYEALGNYPEALVVGEQLRRKLPDNNIIAVAMSECHFSIMDFQQAIAILREPIENFSDFQNLRLKIIQTLLISGLLSEAETEVRTGLQKDPMNMLLHFYLGRIMLLSKRYQEAVAAFRQAISVPGDDGLKAAVFYYLYRLMVFLEKNEMAGKYLRQARGMRKNMIFPTLEEVKEKIDYESLAGIKDEIGNRPWLQTAIESAREICFDTVDLHTFAIGNYGCTSVFEIFTDGSYLHHAIFSNFNLYDNDELFSQIWLPEYPKTPFIDEEGNILTCRFYEINQKGGIASLTFARPWKCGTGSFIYCRLSDGRFEKRKGNWCFSLPTLPMPACRRHDFVILLPEGLQLQNSSVADFTVHAFPGGKAMVFSPRLVAGEEFMLEMFLKGP